MIILKKLNLILFCFLLVGLFLVPFFISAQGLEIQYPSIPFSDVQTPNQFAGQEDALPLYLNYFYHFALMIAGLVTFGTIVFGGVQYLTSVGSMTKIINAKEQIFGGFMGLIILLASYMILIAIDPNLTVFNIAALEEKTKIIDVAEIDFDKTIYFEIPIGMIIENAVLDDLYLQKMNIAKQAAEQASQASQELKDLTDSLREETNKCRCNTTQCANPPGCQGISCPNAQCNKAEIEKISIEIKEAIEFLKEKQEQVDFAKNPLVEDVSQIMAASYLMSVKNEEIFSYNSLLSIEEDYEIESFLDWKDLYLRINNELVKDPLTFYLDKKGSEESIYVASEYLILSSGITINPPEPPEGWPDPPPPSPGTIVWPTETKRITSPYGYRCRYWDKALGCGIYSGVNDPSCVGTKCWAMHPGIDINSNLTNRPIFAAADGKVIRAGWIGSYGNAIYIEHQGIPVRYTRYAHLSKINVSVGQTVTAGQVIGVAGSTGMGTGVHLHFETRDSANRHMNPLNFLP